MCSAHWMMGRLPSAVGILLLLLMMTVTGCSRDDEASAGRTPLDPIRGGAGALPLTEYDAVVTATGDAAVDIPAVQNAVDQGGNILLCGEFSFAGGQVRVGQTGQPVAIYGEGLDAGGNPLTRITGGSGFFVVAQVSAVFQYLWFDGTDFGIQAYYSDGMQIRNNTFTNNVIGVWLKENNYPVAPGVPIPGYEDAYFSGLIEIADNVFSGWYYSGILAQYVGTFVIGQRLSAEDQRVMIRIQNNTVTTSGFNLLGGIWLNFVPAAALEIQDNVVDVRGNYYYGGVSIATSYAPVITGNTVTASHYNGILRMSGVDNGWVCQNTLVAQTGRTDATALFFPVNPDLGSNDGLQVKNNACQGEMDRGMHLIAGTNCQVKNNDFTGIAAYTTGMAVSSWGPIVAQGNQLINNHLPESIPEGVVSIFLGAIEGAGVVPEIRDNLLVGGDTGPDPVIRDVSDPNPDPDIYEGLNDIIWPSFWKSTTPEHLPLHPEHPHLETMELIDPTAP